MQVVTDLIKDVKLPKMYKARQVYDRTHLTPEEIPGIIRAQLGRPEIAGQLKPGMRIALTCGSRGICNYQLMAKTVVDFLKEKGCDPFIVAAMGSHGGATSEGQRQVLESYNITEESMGCPIKTDMDTVPVGVFEEFGTEVRIDKNAVEADAILLFNRIKVHTSFHGPYESGLMKMMSIGLGKQPGAEIVHAVDPAKMHKVVEGHGKVCMANLNVIGGLAVIENAFDETWKLVGLTPQEIIDQEPGLLLEAKEQFATLLFDHCNILVVDKIGKNISGDGMDPNVIGRFATNITGNGIHADRIAVLDLTDETHGNAQGIGLADTTTARLDKKMKREVTYPTCVTNKLLVLDKLPMVMDNDREAIQLAAKGCYAVADEDLEIIRVRDTAHLEYIEISEALVAKARENDRIEILDDGHDWGFDENGNLW